MEYTSTAFAEPLRRVFAELYRPTKELTIDFHPESKYFVQSIEYRSEIRPWFEEFLYDPVAERRAMGQPARAALAVRFAAWLRGLSFRRADTDAGRIVVDR